MHAAGVQLLPGTDAGGYQQHGALPQELFRWQDAGLPAAEILDLATWRARDYLGLPVLTEGAPADLVVYQEDPRQDLRQLLAPKAVVLSGQVVAARR